MKGKYWLLMLLVFMGIFFIRNLMLPMVSDDIPYAFVWDGADKGNLLDGVGPRERITSFGDIVRSQYSHYMTWGGRIIGIGLTQLFAWEVKGLFNFLNTLVFIALYMLLFCAGAGKKLREMNGVYMFWILFALWFLLPDPFLTVLWMCGSCVFLWLALHNLPEGLYLDCWRFYPHLNGYYWHLYRTDLFRNQAPSALPHSGDTYLKQYLK